MFSSIFQKDFEPECAGLLNKSSFFLGSIWDRDEL